MKVRAIIVAGVVLLASTVSLPNPVAASSVATRSARLPAVTWLDEEGRQHVLTEVLASDRPTWDLVVARDLANGAPDVSWGTYRYGSSGFEQRGVRKIEPAPPVEGAVRENLIAVSADGVLTATWVDQACSPTAVCDRWFTRFTADGSAVGSPVLVAGSTDRPVSSLPDGSFLTRSTAEVHGWRGPDGADRGVPDPTAAPGSPTVDHSGRLLSVSSAGVVTRWPAGGPAVPVTTVTTCPDPAQITLARSSVDDSFATICAATATDPAVVERRAADGVLQWRTSAPFAQPDGRLTTPSAALVDESGRVWVGDVGARTVASGPRSTFVQSFTADGPGPHDYWREYRGYGLTEYGIGVSAIVEAPGAGVAIVDEENCCFQNGGFSTYEDRVSGHRISPSELLPPSSCSLLASEVTAVHDGSVAVTFQPCDTDSRHGQSQPFGYRVSASSPGVEPSSVEFVPVDINVPLEAELSVDRGVLTTISITPHNTAGDGPPTVVGHAIAPFATIEAFVTRQFTDLLGAVPTEEPAATTDALLRGTTTPSSTAEHLLDTGLATDHVEPVARLYRAYFLRDPDPSGLDHWVQRSRNQTRLSTISDAFARSGEFQRRYGRLTNQAFVAALYQNVFGRAADPAGLTFWTKRLDAKRASRGSVVMQFSESTEGIRRSAPIVQPLATSWLLLGRLPSPAERTAWSQLAVPHRAVAAIILASAEYAGRVS